jgi:Primase C terminal 2 (PriCT-2)
MGVGMNLDADRAEIAHFVEALFQHASDGTIVSLRAFADDKPWRTDLWRSVRLGPDRTQLIDAALRLATQAASAATPVVLCPPVATFKGWQATEENLADGLAISVDCDVRPADARERLENLLGPASVIVASGGEWTDPATGEVQDKLHLYWRLAVPARTPEEHANLKLARRLAQMIVGADATGVPPVHPLRWPGSWHRKGKPRLARIVGGNPQRETVLSEALWILRDELGDIDESPHRNGEPQAPIERLEAAMLMLPNADRHWDEWNKFGMALWRASGGSDEGLELFKRWSANSVKYNEAATKARWQHYHRSPPNRIGAGTIFYAAAEEWVDPNWDDYGDPLEWSAGITPEPSDCQPTPTPKPNGGAAPSTGAGTPTPKPNGADTDALPAEPGWPVLGPVAYQGLVGKIVRTIEPQSEADPSALLIQLLTAFGNTIGRSCYCSISAAQHHGRVFVALVGDTAVGRKGTALAMVMMLFNRLRCTQLNRSSGLSSGEGLIQAVRDPTTRIKDAEEEIIDQGVADKRLLIIEEELSRVLRVMARPENILSTVLRSVWDGIDLSTMTKSPVRATAPHISIIAHTTKADIVKYLNSTEAANGFGNRFMFWLTKRSKLLPRGGSVDERVIEDLVGSLDAAVNFAVGTGGREMRIGMDNDAWALWDTAYSHLSAERPGMLGAMTARAAPYVRRLALIYALLDRSQVVNRVHLEAALECWRYSEASTRYLFGDATGDALTDEVLRVLKEAGSKGMARSALRNEFGRHRSSAELGRALNLLAAHGLAIKDRVATAGRPVERWRCLIAQG